MKGYRKIGGGVITSSRAGVQDNDNYELDAQIRSEVHAPIIQETEKSGCEDYYIVVYQKVAP